MNSFCRPGSRSCRPLSALTFQPPLFRFVTAHSDLYILILSRSILDVCSSIWCVCTYILGSSFSPLKPSLLCDRCSNLLHEKAWMYPPKWKAPVECIYVCRETLWLPFICFDLRSLCPSWARRQDGICTTRRR